MSEVMEFASRPPTRIDYLELLTLRQEREDLQLQVEGLKRQNDALSEEKLDLQSDLEDSRENLKEFETWMEKVKQEWSEERGRYVARMEQVEDLEEKLRVLQAGQAEQSNKVAKLQASLCMKDATISELEEDKQTREKLLDNARAEADAMKAALEEAQEELDAMQKERLELASLTRAEIEGFKVALSRSEALTDTLNEQLAEAQAAVTAKEQERQFAVNAANSTHLQLNAAEEKVKVLEASHQELEASYQELEASHREMLEVEQNSAQAQLDRVKQEATRKHAKAMAECAASERKSVEEAVKGGQLTIETLEEEKRRLESDLHEARKQSEGLKIAGEDSKAAKQSLQERLAIAERAAVEAREEAALAKAETKTWRAKFATAQGLKLPRETINNGVFGRLTSLVRDAVTPRRTTADTTAKEAQPESEAAQEQTTEEAPAHETQTEPPAEAPLRKAVKALGAQQASSSRMARQASKPAEPAVERAAMPKAGSKRGRKPAAFTEANARPAKQRRTMSGHEASAPAAAAPEPPHAAQEADAAREATTATQAGASVQPGRSKRRGESAPAQHAPGRQAQPKDKATAARRAIKSSPAAPTESGESIADRVRRHRRQAAPK